MTINCPSQTGQLSRAEIAYGAEMELIDGELSTQVAAAVARIESTLASLSQQQASASRTPSLNSLQQQSPVPGHDALALAGVSKTLASTSVVVQRALIKAEELKVSLTSLRETENEQSNHGSLELGSSGQGTRLW